MYQIFAEELSVGEGAVIEEGAVIQGRSNKKAKRVIIGDHAFIGYNSRAFVDELVVGDYTVIHNNAFIAGDLPCRIGHCSWFGQHARLMSTAFCRATL